MPIRFTTPDDVPGDAEILGVPVHADLSVPDGAGAELDLSFLRRCGFEGRPGQAQSLPADDGSTVVALGVGEPGRVDGDALRRAGAALARQAASVSSVATTVAAVAGGDEDLVAAAVEGIALGAYRYAGARRTPPPQVLAEAAVVGAAPGAVRRGRVAAEATSRARDWINTPARSMTPRRLAEVAGELARDGGLRLDVWDEDRIESEGLGGLGGVAAGAEEPPRLIRLAHEPAGAGATVALVGKGITFDSGGLSLKTGTGMMTMKMDMGGGAAVLAAVAAAAELDLPVRVVGWVAATENMPSGTAIHPGDVLVARNGTSIEVLNTDAEGRLVLADALSLAVEEAPDAVVDIATLTGAQRIALGPGVAAVMGTDGGLVDRVVTAGQAAGEPAWELPLVAAYRKKIDSEVADIKNIATDGAAGTIIAGLFLREFVGETPWAHLDIAGPSWSESEDGWLGKGATGWGARTLLELVRSWA
ncbi:MAG TPA: leucyl aminopeptidase [Acidimicrobiales bacterium]|nr:leucyl aminopeptidase [Acidimicrobiales bacterium]